MRLVAKAIDGYYTLSQVGLVDKNTVIFSNLSLGVVSDTVVLDLTDLSITVYPATTGYYLLKCAVAAGKPFFPLYAANLTHLRSRSSYSMSIRLCLVLWDSQWLYVWLLSDEQSSSWIVELFWSAFFSFESIRRWLDVTASTFCDPFVTSIRWDYFALQVGANCSGSPYAVSEHYHYNHLTGIFEKIGSHFIDDYFITNQQLFPKGVFNFAYIQPTFLFPGN